MVTKGHPAYAEQLAQQATLEAIRQSLRDEQSTRANSHNAAKSGLVQCPDCGQLLQHITDTEER